MNCARRHEAGTPIITASLTSAWTNTWAFSGRAHRSITRERRTCSTEDGASIRMGSAGSLLLNGGRAAIRVDEQYPVYLTTGRVVSQYLSGTQTRRLGALVDIYPEPLLEIHPRLAQQYGIADGDAVTIETRRAEITLPALVTKTIRPDTVFIPYHWPGKQSANRLTHRTLDPRSKIPEFKVSACRLRKTSQMEVPI